MFFNTDIIYDSMVNDILDLANLYPISITNEQEFLICIYKNLILSQKNCQNILMTKLFIIIG